MEHGKLSTYTNHKCRCDECRGAWRTYYRDKRVARREAFKADESTVHGKYNTYALGCRCDECKLNMRLRAHKLTPEEYNELLERQDNLCAICKQREPKCIDHDHQTGQVRGLLCYSCNVGIGNLGDSLETVQRAVDYLSSSA